MSKFACPWGFFIRVGGCRIPLHLQNEEDLLGAAERDVPALSGHSLYLSTDVSETEWAGALSEHEQLALLDERTAGDEVAALFPMTSPTLAQIVIAGPNVHDEGHAQVEQEHQIGQPFLLSCGNQVMQDDDDDDDDPLWTVEAGHHDHPTGLPVAMMSGAMDVNYGVRHLDVFLYPMRVKATAPARMMVDAYQAHNIIASCLEADALLQDALDDDIEDAEDLCLLDPMEAGARFGGAGRAGKRVAKRAGRGVKKGAKATRRGAARAGRAVRRTATRARATVKRGAATAKRGISKARAGVKRGVARARSSRVGRAVGSRATKFKAQARGKLSQMKQKLSRKNRNNKPVNTATRGKVKRAVRNLRDKLKKLGGGGAGGGAAPPDGGDAAGGSAPAGGVGESGEELNTDSLAADPGISEFPPPPMPAAPSPLNLAQESMLDSAVQDGLVTEEQLTDMRSSGVSAATTRALPPSVVSALVERDQALERAVIKQAQVTDPRKLTDYRRGIIGDMQMTLDERERWLTQGVAPPRMPLPREPLVEDLSFARAYQPGQAAVPEDVVQGPEPAQAFSDAAETLSVPRSVLEYLLSEASGFSELRNKLLAFTPSSAAPTSQVALTEGEAAEFLRLLDEEAARNARPPIDDEEEQDAGDEEEEEQEEDLCTATAAAFIGLDNEIAAGESLEDSDDSATHPPFVASDDVLPLSVFLMGTKDSQRTRGISGSMEFAYHMIGRAGHDFANTKLCHAMQATDEDIDESFKPSTAMTYSQLGAHVSVLAAAVARQITNAPAYCAHHGSECNSH